MKKLLVSLMAVMLLVGFVPTSIVEASDVEPREIEVSEIENSVEITDRSGRTMTITQNNVNLRTGPGTNFTSLGLVHRGNRGTHLGSRVGSDGRVWHQLRMTSGPNAGRTGWVRHDFAV